MNSPAGAARMFPVAFDYGRFSNLIQEWGDSARRQTSLADAWSERTGVPIDLRLIDEGVSGRNSKRRTDPDQYALARFLKLVESGRVQPGDYLLLENLDRLSREEEVPATHLLTSILMAGVRVVQLAPHELELTAKSDMFAIFRAVMELSRGHGESERKHQLCSASYTNNRKACNLCRCGHERHEGECAQKGCACRECIPQEQYQGQLPAWVRREGEGRGARQRPISLIASRAATVAEIYRLAAGGKGYTEIVRDLTSRRVPAFGDRVPLIDPATGEQARSRTGRPRWKKEGDRINVGRWTRSYVVDILRSRAAMGELATRTGEVLPIPAAVTEDEWLAAQAGRTERSKHRGRSKKAGPVNLFTGMLTDAETSDGFWSITRQGRGRTWRVLVNTRGKECEAAACSFPEGAFEAAVLSCLREIDPAEVLNREGPDRVAVLSGRLEEVTRRRQELEAELRDGARTSKAALRVLAELEDEEATLEEERREAAREAASPLSESWGQAKGLLDVTLTAEQRLRLRSMLRRIVESIHVLIIPRGWDRVAAVQIRFTGSDQARSYLVTYRKDVMPDGSRASRRRRERGDDVWSARSLRHHAELDLRRPADLAALRVELREMDLATV